LAKESTVQRVVEVALLAICIGYYIFLKLKRDEIWWNVSLANINNTEQSWLSRFYNGVSTLFFTILVLIILGIMGYSFLGKYDAEHKKEFPVLVSDSFPSGVAVIRSYGEYLYAIPFNRETKQFESKLVIVKMSDVKVPLSFEKIGPLKPKE